MQRLKNKVLLLFFCVIVQAAFPQHQEEVLQMIHNQSFIDHRFDERKVGFMWVSTQHPILAYNPLSLGFGALMYTYQQALSRHFSANCLYTPSCSGFSRLLITDYGLIKGVILSADRVMRCNRVAAMDIRPDAFDRHSHTVHESTCIYKHR